MLDGLSQKLKLLLDGLLLLNLFLAFGLFVFLALFLLFLLTLPFFIFLFRLTFLLLLGLVTLLFLNLLFLILLARRLDFLVNKLKIICIFLLYFNLYFAWNWFSLFYWFILFYWLLFRYFLLLLRFDVNLWLCWKVAFVLLRRLGDGKGLELFGIVIIDLVDWFLWFYLTWRIYDTCYTFLFFLSQKLLSITSWLFLIYILFEILVIIPLSILSFIFGEYLLSIQDCHHMFRIYFFKKRCVFWILVNLFDNSFRLKWWFEGYTMLFKLIDFKVIVLENKCISIHDS